MVEQGVFIQAWGWDTAKKREGGIWNSVRAVGRGTKRVEEVCRQMAYLEFWQVAWSLVQQCVLPKFSYLLFWLMRPALQQGMST